MASFYLHDIPLKEANARFESALKDAGVSGVLGTEVVPLDENAIQRVLVSPVWAKISSPHYHASAMDGFGVRAGDTVGASLTTPIVLRVQPNLERIGAVYLDTGDLLPEWVDAVVPIENVEPLDESLKPINNPRNPDSIQIRAAVPPWSHVRPMGEDIVETQLVLPSGHILRPVDLGAIAACGHAQIEVARKPKVTIIPTGTELIPIGKNAGPGEIIEFNSVMLAAQVNSWGGLACRSAIVKDDFEQIRDAVLQASINSDLILLNAGSSAGSEDFSARVIANLGDLLVHGVAVRPGHPVIIGMIRRPNGAKITEKCGLCPIIGVPGYPVSAALTGEIFIEPLIARWTGRKPHQPEKMRAALTRKITSPAGDEDYLRVAVGKVDEKWLAAPLSRGSGVITSLVNADGITILPSGNQGYQAGTEIEVRLYRSSSELNHTIFVIGSHDISLDLMAQSLSKRDRRMVSNNVGSLGGLLAIRRGETHFAGSHLLDPATGIYNLAYIQQYIPDQHVIVVHFVDRQQGIMVLRGNPKEIYSLADLIKPGVVFINRQRGAGTRVLLDYQLDQMGISAERISGYNQEEFTHLAVAVAIASGRADCGLGIAAAAQALKLDFIPLYQEEYDLIIPEIFYESDLLSPVRELWVNEEFKQSVAAMPGYGVSQMGNIVARI